MKDNTTKPVFITAMGLPCAGKSTVMRHLAKLCDFPVLLEPEESHWPAAVMERDDCGYFTCLMWFRSTRVPLLYQAQRLQKSGQSVIVDSYYDKAVHDYLGKPGMEWLLDPKDPYFPMAQQVTKLDWDGLPDATCIIAFELTREDWEALVKKRGRQFDQHPGFLKAYETQKYYVGAAERLCKERGIKLIKFQQRMSSPEQMAQELKAVLQKEGVL